MVPRSSFHCTDQQKTSFDQRNFKSQCEMGPVWLSQLQLIGVMNSSRLILHSQQEAICAQRFCGCNYPLELQCFHSQIWSSRVVTRRYLIGCNYRPYVPAWRYLHGTSGDCVCVCGGGGGYSVHVCKIYTYVPLTWDFQQSWVEILHIFAEFSVLVWVANRPLSWLSMLDWAYI